MRGAGAASAVKLTSRQQDAAGAAGAAPVRGQEHAHAWRPSPACCRNCAVTEVHVLVSRGEGYTVHVQRHTQVMRALPGRLQHTRARARSSCTRCRHRGGGMHAAARQAQSARLRVARVRSHVACTRAAHASKTAAVSSCSWRACVRRAAAKRHRRQEPRKSRPAAPRPQSNCVSACCLPRPASKKCAKARKQHPATHRAPQQKACARPPTPPTPTFLSVQRAAHRWAAAAEY